MDKEIKEKLIEELEKEIKQCKDKARRERLKSMLNRLK